MLGRSNLKISLRLAFAGALIAVNCTGLVSPGLAQTSASRLTLQGSVDQNGLPFHRDVFGKSCLTYEAVSHAHIVNPKIFDHIVSVNNHCPQLIRLHLCYRKSEHCVDVQVPSRGRKDVILGIVPSMSSFQ